MNWYVLLGIVLQIICSHSFASDVWAHWHHKHRVLARELHSFLRSPAKSELKSTKWLGYAILYHGSKKDTRCLLKSGASPLIQFYDDFEMLRRLYSHAQLNNFKRLLLRGARYYNPPHNNLCMYETFDRLELPIGMKDYVQALIDFGAFKKGTTQLQKPNPMTLKELATLKVTQNAICKIPGTPTLYKILKKTPRDLHEALAKSLVENSTTKSFMVLFTQMAKLNKKNGNKKFPIFMKTLNREFNSLQAQKYNTIKSAVRDTDAVYDLKPRDFNSIFTDALHLLNNFF